MARRKKQNKVQIVPLGGVGEIGKNMFLIKCNDEMLLLDAGLAFPEEEMLGVDVVIPDYSYLMDNKDKLKGIVLTHGHEDHIGGLPYIMPHLDVPLWGTKLTLGLVKAKMKEFPNIKGLSLNEITPGSQLKLSSNFHLEFFRTNHSIPDSVGVIINTPAGIVVYTSDFKFDQTPVNGLITDYHTLGELGKRNVLAMLSDSTNADRPGYTLSEKIVGGTIDEIFRQSRGRIIAATFASNLHRIQQIIDAAVRYKRKIGITGRSIYNATKIAMELGYLHVPKGFLMEVEKLDDLPPQKVVLITTGSQGEPMSALTRIANSEHRKLEITPGDTVVIAASPIPGNEKLISRTVDKLFKQGADVYYHSLSGVHVSGHGSAEELKLMLNMVKPRYLIPVHGEYRHLVQHAKIAEDIGMPRKNVFVVENGTIMDFTPKSGKVTGNISAGKVMVDGLGIGDVGNVVLRDRRVLSQDGIVVVVVGLKEKQLVSGPEIVTRGFVYVRESEDMLVEAKSLVENLLLKMNEKKLNDWNIIKGEIRERVNRLFWEKTGRNPMILPVIMDIES